MLRSPYNRLYIRYPPTTENISKSCTKQKKNQKCPSMSSLLKTLATDKHVHVCSVMYLGKVSTCNRPNDVYNNSIFKCFLPVFIIKCSLRCKI